jgi:hypothetical protein
MWNKLLVLTLVKPREAARSVLRLGLPVEVLLQAAVAVTCLGMILGYVALRFNSARLDAMSAFVLGNPLLGAVIQFAVLLLIVGAIVKVGRTFGGTGDLAGALAVVVWLDTVMLAVQAAQVLALLLLPPLATLLAIAAILWILWAMASFVGELHGFENTMVVLGGVILTMTLMYFAAAFVLAGFGVPAEGIE